MDLSFWLKLLSSFVVGSLWITLTTLSAERFGSKIGGLIGGLPSTVVIALLFIGLTQTAQQAALATTAMPLAQGLNGLFVITFMLLVGRGLGLAILGSLLVWTTQSSLLYLLNLQSFWVSILGWLFLLIFCYLAVEKWMKVQSHSGLRISYPPSQLVWRALFGGAVICTAVFMGKLGGPLLGGIFGSFPAMFLTTLIISAQMGGASFSRSVGKSILISGLINVPVYEIVVRFLYPRLGLAYGTVIALILALGSGYLSYLFIKNKLS